MYEATDQDDGTKVCRVGIVCVLYVCVCVGRMGGWGDVSQVARGRSNCMSSSSRSSQSLSLRESVSAR